ncbi:hypothetical protein O3M35_012352 [Rhynocoris fuscipes]|uniref:Nitrophorin n=1 Tax=Rhynocoris fuscipes TaxID=488301 RepID=A0AAW1CZF5_9HEMI
MLKHIVVLCLALIPSSFEKLKQYPIKECKHYLPMRNFNETQFFNGTWYLAYAMFDDKERKLVNCETQKGEVLTNGIIRVITSSYYPEVKKFVKSETFILSNNKNKGKYMGESRMFEPDGDKFVTDFITIPLTIIDTDYVNYAVTYVCFYFESLVIGYTSVEVRNKTDMYSLLLAEQKILELGFNIKDFHSSMNLTCKEDANF